MSLSRKAFLGALLATCLATPAFAQAEDWDLKNRKFVTETRTTPVGERDMGPNVKRAYRAPRRAGNSKTH
jgi:hypothetical protein